MCAIVIENPKVMYMNTQALYGGNVIGSGGFGCVFAPPLRCASSSGASTPRPNTISKLMIRKNALEEYGIIKDIRRQIVKIPNHERYFLLDNINMCRPAQLSDIELAQYSRKCHMLEKHGVTAKNMNENLNSLMLINMPRGGVTMEKYIETNAESINHDFVIINDNLIKLYLNGIMKMNRLGIYHCDIKGSNLLIDDKLVPRLIDWGLSNHGDTRDLESWRHYSVQFNTPFTSVLFGAHFEKWLAGGEGVLAGGEGVLAGGGEGQSNLASFVTGYMGKQRHMSVITNIMFMLFMEDIPAAVKSTRAQKDWIYDNVTVPMITNYLKHVIEHFDIIVGGKINYVGLKRYLDVVYIHLVDTWGFVMIYLGELEILYQNVGNLTGAEMRLYNAIRAIFIKYLYTAHMRAPNSSELVADLRRLNAGFKATNYNLYTHTTLAKYTTYRRQKNATRLQISM
jgi:serine/threonine protein kinase